MNTIADGDKYVYQERRPWEIAEELLNHPTYFSVDEYNYMFMP